MILMYKISDFLMDQKNELSNLERTLKDKHISDSKRIAIQEQATYLYSQGLRAMERYGREVPQSVKSFYLGNKQKPTRDKITKELSEINIDYGKINHRIAYIIVAVVLGSLFVLAILFL